MYPPEMDGMRVRRDETTPVSHDVEPIRRSSALVVGAVDDPAEVEADVIARAAVAVLAAPARSGGDGSTPRVRRHPAPGATRSGPPVRRRIQRAAIGLEGGVVDADTDARIRRARGGGRPLDAGIAQQMGNALGHDVSGVRIHTGGESRDLSQRIQAEAFTVGNDIHFRDGMPNTSTPSGQHLLAHELAHTVQQSSGQQGSGARRTIRRVPAKVLIETELYKAHDTEADKVDLSTPSRSSAVPGETLEVEPSLVRTDDGTPPTSYMQTTKVGTKRLKRYIRASAVELAGATGTGKAAETTNDKAGKSFDKVGGIAGVLPEINDAMEGYKKSGGSVAKDTESGMGIAAGAGDTVSMIAGLAVAISEFRKADASGSDKAGAVMSGISSVGAGAKGIATMADKGGAGGGAEAASQGIAGFADAFAGIKDTFFAIKHIVELVNEADKLNDKEKFAASMQIITEAMNVAKSGVSSAKAFMDLWGNGAGAPLVNAVPGLGIALSCVDIIIRAVDLVESQIQRERMQKAKRATKEALGGVKGTSIKGAAEAFVKQIDDKRAAGQPISPADEAKYEQYHDYLLAKGLQYINQKRTNRAIFKIGVAMGKIAGDAAVLGGASAPVGVGIKGGAMALDVGASAFRRFKQWGRDKAAQSGATTGFFSIFDKSKSSDAKLAGYNKMVDKVFDMIIKASALTGAPSIAAELRVGEFVGAMGISLKQMYALKDSPAALRVSMITAMQKRE